MWRVMKKRGHTRTLPSLTLIGVLDKAPLNAVQGTQMQPASGDPDIPVRPKRGG